MRTPGLARVAEAFNRMERFKNGDGDLIGADVDFHIAILEATGNDFLAALGGLIQAALKAASASPGSARRRPVSRQRRSAEDATFKRRPRRQRTFALNIRARLPGPSPRKALAARILRWSAWRRPVAAGGAGDAAGRILWTE